MVDASRFVYGANLDVRRLIATVVGGVLVTVWAMWTRAFRAAASETRNLLVSTFDAYAGLVSDLWMIPANSLAAANQAALDFLELLAPLGPLVWPVAIALVMLTLIATEQILKEMGVV